MTRAQPYPDWPKDLGETLREKNTVKIASLKPLE
jgi:hypothetical protein